jgi:hypothetical protein
MTTWTKRWQGWAVAGALGLWGLGCGNKIPDPPSVAKRALLQSFSGPSSCEDLEKYIEDTAVLEMRTELEAARDGVPSWGWWGGWRGDPIAFDEASPAAAGHRRVDSGSAHRPRNNQVAGIGGRRERRHSHLRAWARAVAASWPAEQTAVQGSLKDRKAGPARCSSTAPMWRSSFRAYNRYPL